MINTSIKILKEMQTESGLFRASQKSVSTGYDRIWIRDNLYISLAFEAINDKEIVEQIYHGLFNLFIKFEWKIDEVVKEKPIEDYKFIHPIYTTDINETKEGWGWKQNDALGGFLFHSLRLNKDNYNIIRDENDIRIIEKIVKYLESIRYWEDEDNGIWEENKEIHSSSVGACVAGIKKSKSFINVENDILFKGEKSLQSLLPRESLTKDVDMSLLSLIYPYSIIENNIAEEILYNLETNLLRNKGVIRYRGDGYYNKSNVEASWTMGLPWLAICYHQLNNTKKYLYYLNKTIKVINEKLELPELYIEDIYPNENSPLGWSQSLLVKALTL